MTSKLRNLCGTINNWTQADLELLLELPYKYRVIGKEIGSESKIPHLQFYIELSRQMEFRRIKKFIPRGHFKARYGEQIEAINYCKKDGDYIEEGIPVSQGARTDLKEMCQAIKNGTLTLDNILEEDPYMYHMYGRTFKEYHTKINRKNFRKWMTTCDWIYGPTGTGKSIRAFKDYNPDTHYLLNVNDGGWWEGYTGQETVIINEFRGQITYGELLDLIDMHPKTVKQRCKEPAQFLAKHIIITSSMHPSEVYYNLSRNDKIEQLYRRINLIYTGEGGTFSSPNKNSQKCSEGNTNLRAYLDDSDDEEFIYFSEDENKPTPAVETPIGDAKLLSRQRQTTAKAASDKSSHQKDLPCLEDMSADGSTGFAQLKTYESEFKIARILRKKIHN
nr:rep protein [Cressdnaviricota sp.]UOF81292.1 rep protein [Cressdnaviricota sp.]